MAQCREFRGVARRIFYDGTGTCFIYHQTVVVKVLDKGGIRLNSGGYRTNTTKMAMNQASNQEGLGFQVFQKDGEWFVTYRGDTIPFQDKMILN